MSRIGQLPTQIPAGVTVTVYPDKVEVRGPRGALERSLVHGIGIEVTQYMVTVRPTSTSRSAKALHGLYRQLIANMVTGVSTGFVKQLEMKGTGYRAEVQANELVLSVGYSHPVRIPAPEGINFKVEKNVQISVEGNDREVVGEVAAKIRAVRKPEPYKGKGIRYSGERIRLKPGKAAKAAA